MTVEEYLVQHWTKRIKDTSKGDLILAIASTGVANDGNGVISDDMTAADVLRMIHEIRDDERREGILGRDLGGGNQGDHFRSATTWIAGAITVLVLLGCFSAILSDGDPSDNISHIGRLVDLIARLINYLITGTE